MLGFLRFFPPPRMTEVEIHAGGGVKQIARQLHDDGILWHPSVFRWWAWLTGSDKKLRAGTYRLDRRAFSPEILWKFRFGRAAGVAVTIPEGFTAEQIAQRLAEKGIASAVDFLRIVRGQKQEGFLFPETYLWEKGTPAEKIVRDMTQEFDSRFRREWEEAGRARGLDRRGLVILASIIEREARLPEERPRISGVFHNRLRRGWKLEADPTVRYALGRWDRPLSQRDLRKESPYNTYLHAGLPPGPICNPGEESLRAAAEPMKTEELYFVLSADGRSHLFSTRLKDHLRNKRKAARIQAGRP